MNPTRGHNTRESDAFVVAAWSATVFGLLEGLVLNVMRAFPALAAPYKVSAHVLWVAPILDLGLFVLVAVWMFPLCWVAEGHRRRLSLLVTYGIFVFVGFLGVIHATRIIGLASGAVLALGLAVFSSRKLKGSEVRLTAILRRRLILIPAVILIVGLGVSGYERAAEAWRAGRLPGYRSGAVNVLVIVMDTVRYDSFARSSDASLTPNLNRIMLQGARFDNAWSSSSWTLPSQASIMTGLYPYQHGADWPRLDLDTTRPTSAEFFAGQGYVTGAFSGNSAWVTPEYLGRGFLRFDGYILEDLLRRTSYGRALNQVLRNLRLHEAGRGKPAAQVNAEFLRFLDDYPERPFYAYLCYMDVNLTFHDRWLNYGFLQKTAPMPEVKQAYDVGLKDLDGQIGRLYAELERRGLLENTLVIITSDHGQSFGEALGDHEPVGHGTSLYPEQTRVPLFVIYPGVVPSERQMLGLVSISQIPSTITHLLDIKESPFPEPPLISRDETTDKAAGVTSELLVTLNYAEREQQAVLWDSWLYIRNEDSASSPSERLYNLVNDPLANHNLASTQDLAPSRARLQRLLALPRAMLPEQLAGSILP